MSKTAEYQLDKSILSNELFIATVACLGGLALSYFLQFSLSSFDKSTSAHRNFSPQGHSIEFESNGIGNAIDNIGKAFAQKEEVVNIPPKAPASKLENHPIENIARAFRTKEATLPEKAIETLPPAQEISEPLKQAEVTATPESIPSLTENAKQLAETKPIETTKANNDGQGPIRFGNEVITNEAEAKAFIYRHESGNRLDAVNPFGCYGLGQRCDNNDLANTCPNWRTDRACQDKYWESYNINRYGTWMNAARHWTSRKPINGIDRGFWW